MGANSTSTISNNPNQSDSLRNPTSKDHPRYSTASASRFSIRSFARRVTDTFSLFKTTEPYVLPGEGSTPRSSTDRSSSSSRFSQQTVPRPKAASSSTISLPYFSDRSSNQDNLTRHHASASSALFINTPPRRLRRVDAVIRTSLTRAATAPYYSPEIAPRSAIPVANMTVTPFGNSSRSEPGKPPNSAQSSSGFGQGGNPAPLPASGLSAGYVNAPPGSLQHPNNVYQYIQDVSSKRISTLEYLRKA